MICEACRSSQAATVRYAVVKGKVIVKGCDVCGGAPALGGIPDVYFKAPYFDSNLADETHTDGIFIESREHKRDVMRAQGLGESGDRKHGARP